MIKKKDATSSISNIYYKKSESIVKNWTKRLLTIIGRITVAKTLILPNITYLASVMTIEKRHINQFKKIIYNFIWDGKREKIKRTVLCKEYGQGGLNVIDIDKVIQAIQVNWVKRISVCLGSNAQEPNLDYNPTLLLQYVWPQLLIIQF